MKKGIILTEPPVYDRCIDSPDSIDKLEQHAVVLKEPLQSSQMESSLTSTTETVHL